MEQPIDIQTLFLEYRKRCYGFFVQTLNDPELAKDLTQDIFLKIIRNEKDLVHIQNWDQFIYTACRNRAFDHLKKAGHDKKYREYLFRYWGQPGNEVRPEVEKTIEAAHYREILEQSLKDLPDQQRIIFNLSKREGLTHKQIAEKLNISPLTVRNHLRRALINIRATAHPDIELIFFLCFLLV